MTTETYLKYITGYRSWRVEQGFLASYGAIWPYNTVLIAKCGKEEHDDDVPNLNCQCGIYAFRTPQDSSYYSKNVAPVTVSGVVALWGKVIEHEDGYRAQYAYPLKFSSLSNPLYCYVCKTEAGNLFKTFASPSNPYIYLCEICIDSWILTTGWKIVENVKNDANDANLMLLNNLRLNYSI